MARAGGIVATYQGFPLQRVVFRRRRGFAADVSEVVLPVRWDGRRPLLEQEFSVAIPTEGELRKRRIEPADLSPIGQTSSGDVLPPAPLPAGLRFVGTLLMASVGPDGTERKVEVPNLIVKSIRTQQTGDVLALVVLSLVDERYLWPRGVMSRWSFNRVRADGTVALDSVREDGEPFSAAEILERYVVPALPRSPALAHVPDRLRGSKGALELPQWPYAREALAKMVSDHATVDPCLRLGGAVALHDPPEKDQDPTRCASSPDGPNDTPIPPEVWLWESGSGQQLAEEQTYPAPYALVVGGPTVATVRIDDWVPVVVHRGEPFALTEELVRELTEGRRGLEWLHVFLMQPPGLQSQVDEDEEILTLLRQQAYRLWRLPGAQEIQDGKFVEGPGTRAHLLPLLDRAEVDAGRRRPVTVEAFHWVVRHQILEPGTADMLKRLSAQEKIQAGKRQVLEEAIRAGNVNNPLANPVKGVAALRPGSVEGSPVEIDYSWALRLDAAREVSPGGVQKILEGRKQLAETLGPEAALRHEFELRLAELHRLATEAGLKGLADALQSKGRGSRGIRLEFEREFKRFKARLAEIRRQAERNKRLGLPGVGAGLDRAVALKNVGPVVDEGARVYSADLGIVQTSYRSGHAADPGVPAPGLTDFVPRPPVVTFGAVVRPRLDVPPDPRRTLTRQDRATAKDDRETYYLAAFKRLGHGDVKRVDLENVALDQAVVLRKPWAELIPLEGESNRKQLDHDAEEAARQALSGSARLRAATRSFAGPWPVQCDGLVSGVEIRTEEVDGIPAGFTTTVQTGYRPAGAIPLRSVAKRRSDPPQIRREAYVK